MKKMIVLFAYILLLFNKCVISQTIHESDSISNIEEAKYLKEDLGKFLGQNTKYPREAITKKIKGDVVISFIIKKDGKLDNLSILSSPDISLSTSAIVAFNPLIDEEWSPAKINDIPIDKEYIIVFNYIMLDMDSPIPDYKSQAEKYYKKQKLDKALKLYNKAIEVHPYDCELFQSRSKIKEILGDIEGSKDDYKRSIELNSDILSEIIIVAYRKN